MDVLVRPADLSDAKAITAFGARVVPAHYTSILGAEAAVDQLRWWTLDRTTASIASGRMHVAARGDDLRGVCEIGEFEGEQVVWKLYVEAQARGRGIGVTLLDQAIRALPDDVDHVLLEHFAGNTRAGAFYDREGFVVVRVVPAASGDPAAAVVWRQRAIRPAAPAKSFDVSRHR